MRAVERRAVGPHWPNPSREAPLLEERGVRVGHALLLLLLYDDVAAAAARGLIRLLGTGGSCR